MSPPVDLVNGPESIEPTDPSQPNQPPEPDRAAGTGTAAGAVLLRLGGSRYAVDMADVAEVATLPGTTRVPGAPAWLVGVANWRGRMLPVVDLRPLLATPVVPLASSARLLVVARDDQVVGLVAEAVPGVYDATLAGMQPAPPTLAGEAARLVIGQVPTAEGPVAVLDIEAVLDLREQLDRRRPTA